MCDSGSPGEYQSCMPANLDPNCSSPICACQRELGENDTLGGFACRSPRSPQRAMCGNSAWAPATSPLLAGIRVKASIAIPITQQGFQVISLQQLGVELKRGEYLAFYSTVDHMLATRYLDDNPCTDAASSSTLEQFAGTFTSLHLEDKYLATSAISVPTLVLTNGSDYMANYSNSDTEIKNFTYAVCLFDLEGLRILIRVTILVSV